MLNRSGDKRGIKHGMRYDPLYNVWGDIKTRCYNLNNKRYKYYKNVNMYKEWLNDFPAFREYCYANGWRKGLVIARHGDIGDYEPNNIKFITPSENTIEMNKRLCKEIVMTDYENHIVEVFENQHSAARYIIRTQARNTKVKTIASNIGRAIHKKGNAYGYEWRWLDDTNK